MLVDHLNEPTVGVVAESGCWMGFSIYPDTKMDEQRMVAILQEYGTERMIVNSAADWGRSDPLKTYKTGLAMLDAGSPSPMSTRSCGRTRSTSTARAAGWCSTSCPGSRRRRETFAGNSVLRGGGNT